MIPVLMLGMVRVADAKGVKKHDHQAMKKRKRFHPSHEFK